MTASPQPQVRTYGGWRRSRGMGLFGLGPLQTLMVLTALTLLITSAAVSFAALAVAAGPCLLVLGANLLRWDGVPVMHGLRQRLRWLSGSSRGHTSYRAGVMAAAEHAWHLPGVLAPTTLLVVHDPTGGDYGLVYDRRLGTMTATLRCAATSTWLADPDAAASWVGNWGGWLAGLGYQPAVRWVSVTVATSPDPGSRLADEMVRREAPHAPAAARKVLHQLVQSAPAAAADVDTRVSITFAPGSSPARPRGLDDALDEVSRTLPGLQDGLGMCGLTVLARATAGDLAGIVRTAYDPTVRGEVARVLAGRDEAETARWLDWQSAGPVAADEHRDRYVHDGATSVSWAWHEAPRQQVHADVLARLLAPGRYPKRVTLTYRPLSAGAAARIVEREVNAAAFRSAFGRAQRRDESARDQADRERAQQTAREEATGAGVGLLSLVATVTVLDPDELGRAVADLEARADVAKIRLRRLWHSQAAGFAATLPCGVCLPVLATHWPR